MQTQGKYYWNIDRIMWLIIGCVLTATILWLIYYLRDALLPFFTACVIAYLLQPLVDLNSKYLHLKGRTLASVLALLEVSVVVGLIIWLAMPSVLKELDALGRILSDVSSGKIALPAVHSTVTDFISRNINPGSISSTLSGMNLEGLMTKATSLLESSASVIIRTIEWFLTIIYVLFILIDYPQIVRGFKQIIPLRYRKQAMVVVNDIIARMNGYFRGQGVVALVAMVLYCAGFLIVGLPLAVPMGVIVGILYMIPYFQYVTLIPVCLICLIYSIGGEVEFLPEFGKCLLVYLCSQSICDYIVTPHVMGKELGLNPAIILLSLSVWGSLLGIIGMIIALPVTALIMTYYQVYISNRK